MPPAYALVVLGLRCLVVVGLGYVQVRSRLARGRTSAVGCALTGVTLAGLLCVIRAGRVLVGWYACTLVRAVGRFGSVLAVPVVGVRCRLVLTVVRQVVQGVVSPRQVASLLAVLDTDVPLVVQAKVCRGAPAMAHVATQAVAVRSIVTSSTRCPHVVGVRPMLRSLGLLQVAGLTLRLLASLGFACLSTLGVGLVFDVRCVFALLRGRRVVSLVVAVLGCRLSCLITALAVLHVKGVGPPVLVSPALRCSLASATSKAEAKAARTLVKVTLRGVAQGSSSAAASSPAVATCPLLNCSGRAEATSAYDDVDGKGAA